MSDYDRIATLIRYLDEHRAEQPDLATLAAVVGLSPHHLHRLFHRWAGVTPKDFLQALTHAHARDILARGVPVLDTAIAAGLSGPGRLHDLCLRLDAASPGEIKTGGLGWTIRFGVADSPFGRVLIADGRRGICHLAFLPDDPVADLAAPVRALWPAAQLTRDDRHAATLAARVFRRPDTDAPALRACVRASKFQLTVWRALLTIPPGHLASYGQLAQAIGHPRAARAVGTAVAANPIAYLIPCHRVIRQTGVIGDYRWSPLRKQAIIAAETA